jgi:hypothetical protein
MGVCARICGTMTLRSSGCESPGATLTAVFTGSSSLRRQPEDTELIVLSLLPFHGGLPDAHSGQDLSGIDLSDADLNKIRLDNADLEYSRRSPMLTAPSRRRRERTSASSRPASRRRRPRVPGECLFRRSQVRQYHPESYGVPAVGNRVWALSPLPAH